MALVSISVSGTLILVHDVWMVMSQLANTKETDPTGITGPGPGCNGYTLGLEAQCAAAQMYIGECISHVCWWCLCVRVINMSRLRSQEPMTHTEGRSEREEQTRKYLVDSESYQVAIAMR